MAYPASSKTHQQWLEEVDQQVNLLKVISQNNRAASAASQLSMDMVRTYFDFLVQCNNFLTAAVGVTNFAAYVTSQKQGAVADPFAELNALKTQVVATLDWLRANVPEDTFVGQVYKLAFKFPSDNVTTSSSLVFTAGQTAGFRTVVDALIAAIT